MGRQEQERWGCRRVGSAARGAARRLEDYRIRFRQDCVGSSIDGCDGKPLPEAPEVYAENQCLRPDGTPIPYDEYCDYYGNPDRHVLLMADVQRKCPCCGHWTDEDEGGEPLPSVGRIDLMDDSPDLYEIGSWYGPPWAKVAAVDAIRLPRYLAEIARELLGEIDGLEVPVAE